MMGAISRKHFLAQQLLNFFFFFCSGFITRNKNNNYILHTTTNYLNFLCQYGFPIFFSFLTSSVTSDLVEIVDVGDNLPSNRVETIFSVEVDLFLIKRVVDVADDITGELDVLCG
jgi:hypothetical protein